VKPIIISPYFLNNINSESFSPSDTLSLRPMKKKVTYLCILFLATLIFYGGAGVNLVTYCCGDCRSEGVAVLLDTDCCEVHGHEHGHTDDGQFAGTHTSCGTEETCCDMERVNFDWNSISQLAINLQPVVINLLSFGISPLSLLPHLSENELFLTNDDAPPIVCPRIYLSLLTTLLI
jgi:hypothetical protein